MIQCVCTNIREQAAIIFKCQHISEKWSGFSFSSFPAVRSVLKQLDLEKEEARTCAATSCSYCLVYFGTGNENHLVAGKTRKFKNLSTQRFKNWPSFILNMTIAVIPPCPLRSGPFAPLDVQIWALGQTRRSCQGLLRTLQWQCFTQQLFFLLFANMKVRWMCRWRMKGHWKFSNDKWLEQVSWSTEECSIFKVWAAKIWSQVVNRTF